MLFIPLSKLTVLDENILGAFLSNSNAFIYKLLQVTKKAKHLKFDKRQKFYAPLKYKKITEISENLQKHAIKSLCLFYLNMIDKTKQNRISLF